LRKESDGAGPKWDSHVHILPGRRTRGLVRWIKKTLPGHPSREDYSPEDIVRELRSCGVVKIFNLVFPLRDSETESLNVFSKEMATVFEEVIGFGSMHLETRGKDRVANRCVCELGLAGIKLHPYVQGFDAFSEPFEPLYRELNRLERPFLVHTGFDAFYNRTQNLVYLEGILRRYPDMPVVLVHSLFPRFGLAGRLMDEYPQLYLDMTNVMTSLRFLLDTPGSPRFEDMVPSAISDNLDGFFAVIEKHADRIMFGTDHPAGMWSVEKIYADFDSFTFPERVRRRLLYDTARDFYYRYCSA
jgi:uncharacterized protein